MNLQSILPFKLLKSVPKNGPSNPVKGRYNMTTNIIKNPPMISLLSIKIEHSIIFLQLENPYRLKYHRFQCKKH